MGDLHNTLTFDLFARPSLIEGIGRIVDFGSGLQIYNYSRTGPEADEKALHNDWKMVGNDIKSSINKYGRKK